MIPTFAPPQNPGFEFAHPQQYVTDPVTTHKGYEQELPRQPVPLLSAVLEWKAALPDTMAYIVSFFRQFNGRSGPFLWTPPDPIEDPLGIAPRLSSVSKGFGGSGATRTVQITWRDSVTGGETRASASSSLAVPAGHGIVVQVPALPAGIDSWGLYFDEGAGPLRAAYVTGSRRWEQPNESISISGSPPSVSTLLIPLRWKRVGEIERTLLRSGGLGRRYRIRLQFQQSFI